MRVGEYDLGLEEDCDEYGYCAPPPQDFSPVEVIIHQQYNKPNKFQHDIAIIKLDRDVLENGRIISFPYILSILYILYNQILD